MKKLRIKLTDDQIELILDYLSKGLTEAKFKKDRKRGEATYDTYQLIGQALGEKNIILEFESVWDDTKQDVRVELPE